MERVIVVKGKSVSSIIYVLLGLNGGGTSSR